MKKLITWVLAILFACAGGWLLHERWDRTGASNTPRIGRASTTDASEVQRPAAAAKPGEPPLPPEVEDEDIGEFSKPPDDRLPYEPGADPPITWSSSTRVLPTPRGPGQDDSLRAYLDRNLGRIVTLDGSAEGVQERRDSELELEAFGNRSETMVRELIEIAQDPRSAREGRLALLLLGRIDSDSAVLFLLNVAAGETAFDWPPQSNQGPPILQSPPGTPRTVAVDALFQSRGEVGPGRHASPAEIYVYAGETALKEPLVLAKLASMLRDEYVDRDVRWAILKHLRGTLERVDPLGGASPAEEVTLAVQGMTTDRDPLIRSKARGMLSNVKSESVARFLMETAYAEKDPGLRGSAFLSAAQMMQFPVVRDRLVAELYRRSHPDISEGIIQGLSLRVVMTDGAVREALLSSIASDANGGVRIMGFTQVCATGDPALISRALDSIDPAAFAGANARKLAGQLTTLQTTQRPIPPEIRQRAKEMLARVSR